MNVAVTSSYLDSRRNRGQASVVRGSEQPVVIADQSIQFRREQVRGREMDRVKGTEPAVWLTHRGVHDLVVDRDVGEGSQQIPGFW